MAVNWSSYYPIYCAIKQIWGKKERVYGTLEICIKEEFSAGML